MASAAAREHRLHQILRMGSAPDVWPELPLAAWRDTRDTLHRWVQIVGKVRLALTPWVNHSWHATLYVTTRGLTTSLIPYGRRVFQIDFDFVDQALAISTGEGERRRLELAPISVAAFHESLMAALGELGIRVRIHEVPNEVEDAIPLHEDRVHRIYDSEYARRYWQTLLQVHQVFSQFRTGFVGKVSPVHLYWGALDMAVTRFSGRGAPPHPGGIPRLPDQVTREAYSHELSSAGFWPGGGGFDDAAFYSYAYPEPAGFSAARIETAAASYYERLGHEGLGEFVLPYAAVREANDPEATLLAFLQSTYEAAATLGGWDRDALECPRGRPGIPRPL